MRCKCCDAVIKNNLTSKRKPDGTLEDMCRLCVSLSFDSTIDKEYVQGLYTEDTMYVLTGKFSNISENY